MICSWTERLSASPLIKSVWWHVTSKPGSYISLADGGLDMVILKERGRTRLLLSGPTTKARPVNYQAGVEAIGIRLRMGVYVPSLSAKKLLDTDFFLPNADDSHFIFDSHAFAFPTFETAEQLVVQLTRHNLIRRDPVIAAFLERGISSASQRTVQRRFVEITGLSPYCLMQIRRAERAAELLQQPISLPYAATEAGYIDQPHMTRAARKFLGYTPSQFRTVYAGYAQICR